MTYIASPTGRRLQFVPEVPAADSAATAQVEAQGTAELV